MRVNLYSQNKHTVIVNGVPLSGFAEGDFMEIKADGNAAERTKGADGPSISISTAQGGQITIGLQPVSPALGLLYSLRNSQITNPSLFSIVLMTGVEEVITAAGCAFGDLAQFATGGEKMSPRKFVFECSKITLDVSSVAALTGGLVDSLIGDVVGTVVGGLL